MTWLNELDALSSDISAMGKRDVRKGERRGGRAGGSMSTGVDVLERVDKVSAGGETEI